MSASLFAVIVYDSGSACDERLAATIAQCRAQGLVVTGLIQHNDGDCALPGFAMALEDIGSGQRIAITEVSVISSRGCKLDVGGLAEAAATLDVERHRNSDFVVVNKFGRQEMMGRGLRSEMAALLAFGLPVLTCVRRDFLPEFEAFAGTDWVEITPEAHSVSAWLASLAKSEEMAPAS